MKQAKITTVELDREYVGREILDKCYFHYPYITREIRIKGKIGKEFYFYRRKDEECKEGIIRDRYPMFFLLLIDPERKYKAVQIKTYYTYLPWPLRVLKYLWVTFFVKTDYFGEERKRLLRDPETIDKDLEELISTFKDFLSRI